MAWFRTECLSTSESRPIWNARNRAIRFQTELSGQIGYDSLKYHYATGPLSGSAMWQLFAAQVSPLAGSENRLFCHSLYVRSM